MAWWQANVDTSHRTWVRFPGPPKIPYYFSLHACVQVSKEGPSYTSQISMPSGHKGESKGQGWMTTMFLSQHARRPFRKSNVAESLVGWKIAKKPPSGPNTPWFFLIFFFVFFLFLFAFTNF